MAAHFGSLSSDGCPSFQFSTPDTGCYYGRQVDPSLAAISIPVESASMHGAEYLAADNARGGQQFRSLPTETNYFADSPTDHGGRNGCRRDPIKRCPCVDRTAAPRNKRCSDGCIRLCIFKSPDKVRWHGPEKVIIVKDQAGKLGFRFKEIETKGETYTLVLFINHGGPAEGKLAMGDHILSANGTPLNKNKNLTEVIQQSSGNTMCIFKCRPMGLLPLQPKFNRSPSAPNPDVQISDSQDCPVGRRTSGKSADNLHHSVESNAVKRTDSSRSKSSGNSGETSPVININISLPSPTEEQKKVPFPPGLNGSNHENANLRMKEFDSKAIEKQYQLIEAHIDKTLSSDMPRLPGLRLVVIGNDSNNVVKSLLPGEPGDPALRETICTRYNCQVTRENDWVPKVKGDRGRLHAIVKAVREAYGEPIPVVEQELSSRYSKLLRQVCLDTPELDSADFVDLEILAMSDTPLGAYCGHIHYTAHSVYVIQFGTTEYLEHQEYVLTYIQNQLVKIRTYASDTVQVLLVATSRSTTLTQNKMASIGQSLHNTFSKAYGNQLDYNPVTNMPCYFLMSSDDDDDAGVDTMNDLSRVPYSQQVSCEDNEEVPHDDESISGANRNPHAIRNPQSDRCPDVVVQTNDLKSRINSLIFQQPFVSRRYPYRFLVYRDQVKRIRDNQPVGAQKSEITQDVSDEEKTAFLKYLHNCGDIICIDQLQYMMSQHLLHSRLSFMVLLSREHLITAACQLLTIPSLSNQNPKRRRDWKTLQDTAQISCPFLVHLLGQDADVLCIFLDMMNVIFCMDDGMQVNKVNKAPWYLVPYHLPRRTPEEEEEAESTQSRLPQRFDPYILHMDFSGFIPHGTFISVLLQLIGVAIKTKGSQAIHSQLNGHVSFADDCQLQITCDELGSRIKISAECKMTYHPRHIFTVLSETMKVLKPSQSDMRYKCGPPCPLCLSKDVIHVLDISDNRGQLWCGNQRVDQDPSVMQWFMEKPRDPAEVECEPQRHIQTSNHIKHLPPSLHKWICNQLNVHFHSGHDWKMLADFIGYDVSEIRIFETQHVTTEDPCDSLLRHWGRQSSSATLEKLRQHLYQMERHDLLTDMSEQWSLIK